MDLLLNSFSVNNLLKSKGTVVIGHAEIIPEATSFKPMSACACHGVHADMGRYVLHMQVALFSTEHGIE